jgi:hypothetical protein
MAGWVLTLYKASIGVDAIITKSNTFEFMRWQTSFPAENSPHV